MNLSGNDFTRGTLEFGPFRLYIEQRTLMKYDRVVRLGSRARDILFALVSRRGEVISKSELLSLVWPRVVVEEATLRVHIAAVRKALGEQPPHTRYIENVNGHGYRFIAPMKQVATPELAASAANDRKAAIPARLVRMIGRDDTLASLIDRVQQRRFVTVAGPGGIGKTTVAVAALEQLGAHFPDGVHFVDLTSVADASEVTSHIATTLGLPADGTSALDTLVARLRYTRSLIVLDNCEHVIEPLAPLVEGLLAATCDVHFLATSREPLNARGESVLRLPPLASPPAHPAPGSADAMRFPAVELFVEYATAESHDYELTDTDAPNVSEICRRLDGLPLAIELAAAHVGLLGAGWLAAHIDDHLNLLTRGRRTAAPRHRSLRASMEWSWNLLSSVERAAMSQLACFSGPFSFASAQAALAEAAIDDAAAPDVIANLAAKFLVVAENCAGKVQLQLPASTRAYALETKMSAA